MMDPRRDLIRRLLFGGLAVLLGVCPAAADAQSKPAPRPATRAAAPTNLAIVPNAIQDLKVPMQITAQGTSEAPHIFVLQDCNGDGYPELEPLKSCKNPLVDKPARFENGWLHAELKFDALPDVPKNKALWVSVCASANVREGCADAYFVVGGERCALWQTVKAVIGGGECDPKLGDLISTSRGGLRIARRFAVRVALVDDGEKGDKAPTARWLDGGADATGVAWKDEHTLLVTRAAPREASSARTTTWKEGDAGLWELPLDKGEARKVWAPPSGFKARAALPLRDGATVLVLLEDDKSEAAPHRVVLVRAGKTIQEFDLPVAVIRLLSASADGSDLLGESLGEGGADLVVSRVRLPRGDSYIIPGAGLVRVSLQRPRSGPLAGLAAIDYEDVATRNGWDIALVDGNAQAVREIAVAQGDSWAPAWSPSGRWLAWLEEMTGEKR